MFKSVFLVFSFCLTSMFAFSQTSSNKYKTLEGNLVSIGGTRGDIVLTVQSSDGQYRVWPYYPPDVNGQQLLLLERAWKANTEQIRVGDRVKLDCPQIKGYDPVMEVRVASCERIVKANALSAPAGAGGGNTPQSEAGTSRP